MLSPTTYSLCTAFCVVVLTFSIVADLSAAAPRILKLQPSYNDADGKQLMVGDAEYSGRSGNKIFTPVTVIAYRANPVRIIREVGEAVNELRDGKSKKTGAYGEKPIIDPLEPFERISTSDIKVKQNNIVSEPEETHTTLTLKAKSIDKMLSLLALSASSEGELISHSSETKSDNSITSPTPNESVPTTTLSSKLVSSQVLKGDLTTEIIDVEEDEDGKQIYTGTSACVENCTVHNHPHDTDLEKNVLQDHVPTNAVDTNVPERKEVELRIGVEVSKSPSLVEETSQASNKPTGEEININITEDKGIETLKLLKESPLTYYEKEYETAFAGPSHYHSSGTNNTLRGKSVSRKLDYGNDLMASTTEAKIKDSLTSLSVPELIMERTSLTPVLTNKNTNHPVLTNQNIGHPSLTIENTSHPMLPNWNIGQTALTNQTMHNPVLTNQDIGHPALTNQSLNHPVLSDQSTKQLELNNQSTNDKVLKEKIIDKSNQESPKTKGFTMPSKDESVDSNKINNMVFEVLTPQEMSNSSDDDVDGVGFSQFTTPPTIAEVDDMQDMEYPLPMPCRNGTDKSSPSLLRKMIEGILGAPPSSAVTHTQGPFQMCHPPNHELVTTNKTGCGWCYAHIKDGCVTSLSCFPFR